MDFQILAKDIEAIVDCSEGAIERLLMVIKVKLEFQADPEALQARQAEITKLMQQKANEKVTKENKKGDNGPKKPAKENRSKTDIIGIKIENNLEKQVFDKNQKITEMATKIALLEQKLRNCEELLAVKEEKIRILQGKPVGKIGGK